MLTEAKQGKLQVGLCSESVFFSQISGGKHAMTCYDCCEKVHTIAKRAILSGIKSDIDSCGRRRIVCCLFVHPMNVSTILGLRDELIRFESQTLKVKATVTLCKMFLL